MSLTPLNAISPIDGRYRSKSNELARYFSEEALIQYRVLVEIEYFIALCTVPLPQLKNFDEQLFPELRSIYKNFSAADAKAIKDIEGIKNIEIKKDWEVQRLPSLNAPNTPNSLKNVTLMAK